ncbi:MAG: hypothetical protein AB8U25_00435 [Rickettsiales endosymbiont of Dermacentor nuttalli]
MVKSVITFILSLMLYFPISYAQTDNNETLSQEISNLSPIMIIRFNNERPIDFSSSTKKMINFALKNNPYTQFIILSILNDKESMRKTYEDTLLISSVQNIINIMTTEGVTRNNIHTFTQVQNSPSEPNEIRIFVK